MAEQQATTPRAAEVRLAPLYDAAVALLSGDGRWRTALALQVAPEAHDFILDVGCGAGGLALLLKRMAPQARVIGMDPRPELLAQARMRAEEAGLQMSFIEGDARDAGLLLGARAPSKIVLTLTGARSSTEKLTRLQSLRQIMDPDGVLHVVDYGQQRSLLMRRLFAARRGEGAGEAMTLLRTAGFVAVEETAAWSTAGGTISLYRARAS
jgi:ubiquinone/menaquinone biosynthesis C-methylase UbiE